MDDSQFHRAISCPKHIVAASVVSIREIIVNRKSKVMFLISVTWSDGRSCEILKRYKDFFDLQCSILDEFPVEAGEYNNERIIPYLPGRKIFRKDDISLAEERKPDLDSYVKKLIALEPIISQHKMVLDFFESEEIERHNDDESFHDICKDDTITCDSLHETEKTTGDCLSYVNTSYTSDHDEKPHA